MVGHSGVLPAAVQAVETVDRCLERVLQSAERRGATLLITADHGNCELMIDPTTDGPHTAHTTNPVPFLIVGDDAPAVVGSIISSDRKSTRLNSSHPSISYAVFCLKKKKK